MQISDIETPAPLVDFDIVQANIRRLQDYCDSHQISLRPHIKTHKLPFLAHAQMGAGAAGITVQKLGEAEVMAYAGIADILITYNLLGPAKAERLAHLTHLAKMSVAIDNLPALNSIASASGKAKSPIGVLIEFESGGNRQGVRDPESALELARKIQTRPGLEFRGLMTYPTTAGTGEFLKSALPLFKSAGIQIDVVSGGGTPSAFHNHELAPITELRAGTYIYNDRMMIAAGAAQLKDCAFAILATVVSRPARDRAIVDAGSKTLASDRLAPEQGDGYGLLPDYPGATMARLNEEHGIIDLSQSQRAPEIGERIRIIPNHVCVVTNLHDHIYLCRQKEMIAKLPVSLRGKTV
jgi:D-serine deaminase-like pyridoxal phosphate-dependent protein